MKIKYLNLLIIISLIVYGCGKTNNTVNPSVNVPVQADTVPVKYAAEWKGVVWDTYNDWTTTASISDAADVRSAGIRWARLWFSPVAIAAQNDAMVNLCKSSGVKVLACYNKTDPSADLGTADQQATQVAALRACVQKYKSYIHDWEIQNEPNLSSSWNPTDYSATATPNEVGRGSTDPNSPYNAGVTRYVQWLQLAYNAIKAEDPTATVILGGTSEYIMEDFLDRLTIEKAYNYCDEVAFHPYGNTPDKVISRLTAFKNKMASWPAPKNNMPIWITEVGFTIQSSSSYGVADEGIKGLYLQQTLQKLMVNMSVERPIFWYTLHEKTFNTDYFNLINRSSNTAAATYYLAYTNYQNMAKNWTYYHNGGQ